MKVGYERTGDDMGWPGPYPCPRNRGQGTSPAASGPRASEATASIKVTVTKAWIGPPGVDWTSQGKDRVYETDWAITAGCPPFLTTTNMGKVQSATFSTFSIMVPNFPRCRGMHSQYY